VHKTTTFGKGESFDREVMVGKNKKTKSQIKDTPDLIRQSASGMVYHKKRIAQKKRSGQ